MSATSSRPWLSSYAPGVPADIDLPDESLTDMLDDAAARFADLVALDFYGATTTYRQLGDQVSRAAHALRGLGVGSGDRVALVMPNCPQHVVAFYAVLRLGGIVVEHNPLYTAESWPISSATTGRGGDRLGQGRPAAPGGRSDVGVAHDRRGRPRPRRSPGEAAGRCDCRLRRPGPRGPR